MKDMNPVLFWAKVVVGAGAIGLDLAGKLTPQGSAIVVALLASLGLAHLGAMLKAPSMPGLEKAIAQGLDVLVRQVVLAMPAADRPTPPDPVAPVPTASTAPKVVGGAALVLLGLYFAGQGACSPTTTPGIPTSQEVLTYGARLQLCVATNDTRAAIDACRARERAAWCVSWPSAIDCADAAAADAGRE